MIKPKFEVGEVVRAVDCEGKLFAESTMILSRRYYERAIIFNETLCRNEIVSGFTYKIDALFDGVIPLVAVESQLSRIPPPQKTWEQLRAELKNPLTRELS